MHASSRKRKRRPRAIRLVRVLSGNNMDSPNNETSAAGQTDVAGAPPLGKLPSPLAHPDITAIWVAAAGEIGWRVERAATAYASSHGDRRITIGVDEILDADDAVAQLIFHELCHGLVEGPQRWSLADWGLCNADDRDVAREHACLRVQIHLAEAHGLRELMAPTTEYRAFHDAIAGDPLAPEADPAVHLARAAVGRSATAHWITTLGRALGATRAALDDMGTNPPAAKPAALHPVGFAFTSGDTNCGTCAWFYSGGRGRPVERCRQSAGADGNGRRTQARFRACVRWEPTTDCQTCGACCREAYHSVTVSMRDPVVWKQPHLISRTQQRFEVRREGERCAALDEGVPTSPNLVPRPHDGGAAPAALRVFSCQIYEDRPQTCRDFQAGGRHCLVARRRVGLTP